VIKNHIEISQSNTTLFLQTMNKKYVILFSS